MPQNILVVAAHPDDELLGAGATLAKHAERGDTVYCLILGEGAMSRENGTPSDVQHLQKQSRQAGEIIGFRAMEFCAFPDNAFDSVRLLDLAKAVESALVRIKPDVLYTHHEYDLNIDHRRMFKAVLTACRPCNEFAPKTLYTFETLSSTEWQSKDEKQFAPDTYSDVSLTLEKKMLALKCYAGELRPYPHSRSLEGVRILAKWRGLESHLSAAEAFMTIRRLI